jgi:phosphopentomutase
MLYGHREDAQGYYEGLKIIDKHLSILMDNLHDDDVLIITGDHGTDPTDGKTDHSREYVPFVIFKNNLNPKNIGSGDTFANIASTISEFYGLENIFTGKSVFKYIS